ncbi:right-handed parallel beta-helix repeat-containing protein [Candidatus Nitrospira neomarina]|uniref:Right-handed parallel beta-helix repeat-containing protein n=1 Tax=Candidatus Nitrospira neomarina TaxID=3020899 RepID=A0AA96GPN6_9BACT|nr:right-handed parallel beta-helix repeat-containing protein [Candidatus Nitrospira neomarina]WNM64085.1 right-handed parallel beta-helix repeat-containing protein [Candidatus Nitrospira neomarina]
MRSITNMRFFVVLGLFVFIVTPGAYAAEFFVTHAGQSLNEVRQAVREYKKGLPPKESITVWLEKGTYYLDAPVEFDEKDSGSEKFPIIYRSKPGETVSISGGRKVNGFVPVTDEAILSRLESSARPHIVEADLNGWKDVDFGEPVPVFLQGQWPQANNANLLELFYDSKRMPLSRWPNAGYTNIDRAVGPTKITSHRKTGTVEAHFTYFGSRPERWFAEADIYLNGFFFWDWANAFEKIETIDTVTKTIKAAPESPDILHPTPYSFHKYGHRDGQRYFALNLLSEIDSPGEWFFDRNTKKIYFYPPGPLEPQTVELSILPLVLSFNDTSWVTFQDIFIEESRNTLVSIKDGKRVLFAKNTFRNSAGYAVNIERGFNHEIKNSEIKDAGQGGILIRKAGDRLTLTPANHIIDNNVIHHIGVIQSGSPGIVLSKSVGVTISHNELYDMPHNAIKLGGNDHIVEYNEIYNVVKETSDSGAIYIGRDWTERGHIVRYNYFHDLVPIAGGAIQAVYLDDLASGFLIQGNIFHNVQRGILLGGGRDNRIVNNIFSNTNLNVYIDGRGAKPKSSHIQPNGQTMKALLAMPYKKPPWSTRYPQLVNILNEKPGHPLGNLVEHNLFLKSGKLLILPEAEGLIEFNQNFEEGTPNFNTVMKSNFQVDSKSKSLEFGFNQIPFHEIGKY